MALSTVFCDSCGAANQPQASFCRTCGSPLQSAAAPSRNTATGRLLTNHLLKQRYRILDAAGKGGMGAVYRAEDTQLGNRKVAIKEMSQSGLSPQEVIEAAESFKQEAHILAGLQHPNLPNIFDHFPEAGRWYLVMSFIQGETLEEYLKNTSGGKLPAEEVLQIGIQLCTVLSYLHTQQPPIIFRDLKPSNIMRTADGHLYLIDFGIARHFKPGQAKDTAIYGSMGYAAPEQYGQAQTTPRSDIYSLGAVFYQLLTGYEPFLTPFRFPPLQSQAPATSAELAALITQMLELDENKRPASMLEVMKKLQSIASSLTNPFSLKASVPAAPPPLPPTMPATLYSSAAPLSMAPPISANPPVNISGFGRRQLICAAIGVILYPTTFFILGHLHAAAIINDGIYGVNFAILLFLTSISGPWGGLATLGAGSFAGIIFIGSLSTNWYIPLLLALLGFASGKFAHRLLQRNYHNSRQIAFGTTFGITFFNWALYIIYVLSFYIVIVPIVNFSQLQYLGNTISRGLTNGLLESLPIVILLPILLSIYNVITGRRSYP